MTANEHLAAIKARAEAATEGPWKYREEILGLPNTTVMAGNEQVGYVAVGHFLSVNANFIAHARTDVPALVAALEAVLEVHVSIPDSRSAMYPEPQCLCGVDYPCPTVQAINEALGVDQ